MNTKFINTLERREQTYEWAKSGTINILPAISHESAVFQIKHLMEMESKLNQEILAKREAQMWHEGDAFHWIHGRNWYL